MDNPNATPPRRAGLAARGVRSIPNPLAVLVPVGAVAAAALVVAPLVAAERFAGGRPARPEDAPTLLPATAAEAEPAVERQESSGTETAEESDLAADSATETDAPTMGAEPIAIESRQGTARTGAKRERGERNRGERPLRDERARRRSSAAQADQAPLAASRNAEGSTENAPAVVAGGGSATTDPAAPDASPSQPDAIAGPLAAPAEGTTGDAAGPPSAAPAVADARPPIELQQEAARRGALVAPVIGTAGQSTRAVERMRVQKEAAEAVILNSPDVTAAVAPLIRHMNAVTTQLNEAHLTIGRLTAERDAMQQRLVNDPGALAEQLDQQMSVEIKDTERRQNQLARIEAREARRDGDEPADEPGRFKRFFQRAGLIIPDDAPEESYKQAARKRQMLALVIMATIGLGMWLFQRDGQSVENISRGSLGQLQYVGMIFQVLLIAWMLFRVVRVGGKGAKWLFPQQPTRRRKR